MFRGWIRPQNRRRLPSDTPVRCAVSFVTPTAYVVGSRRKTGKAVRSVSPLQFCSAILARVALFGPVCSRFGGLTMWIGD